MARMTGYGLLLVAMIAIAPIASAQQPMAVVDVQEVMANSARGQEIQQQLKTEFQGPINQMRIQEEALTSLGTQISNQAATLSEEALEALRRKYQDQQLQLQRLSQDTERSVLKRKTELFDDLEIKILEATEAVRKENGIGIVLSMQYSGLLASDPALDLTDEVLTRLNSAP